MIEGTGFEFSKEGAKRPLLVTDEVLRGTGLVDRVIAGLEDGGLEAAAIFDSVPQDSDTAVVVACAAAAKEAGADSFLAVGGGSVMDTAKAANVIFTHGGAVADWEGVYVLPREDEGLGRPLPLAPAAAIPTTAGTGSEVSPVAVIKDSERQIKFVILDFTVAPDLAILDPVATETLPARDRGGDRHGRAHPRDRGAHLDRVEPPFRRLRAARDPADPREPRASRERSLGRGRAREHAGRRQPGDRADRARGDRHRPFALASLRGPLRSPARGRQRDPPAGDDRVQRRRASRRSSTATGRSASCSTSTQAGAERAVGSALADWVRDLRSRLGLPGRLSEVGVPEEGIPQLAADAMGEGSTLVNPARALGGGLRRALPQGTVSAADDAAAWAGIVAEYGKKHELRLRRRSAASTPSMRRRRYARAARTGSPVSSRAMPGARAATPRSTRPADCSRRRCCRAASWSRPTCPTSRASSRSSTSSRSRRTRRTSFERVASRRKVEFESLDFNKRFLATVPRDHDPIALRELFGPAFLDWVTTIDREIDFGVSERQIYFLWRLRDRPPRSSSSPSRAAASSSAASAARWRSTASSRSPPAPGTRGWSRSRPIRQSQPERRSRSSRARRQ